MGDGKGEVILGSFGSGIDMLRGIIFLLGGEEMRDGVGGSNSSTSDRNSILIFVLGNRSVHLQIKKAN